MTCTNCDDLLIVAGDGIDISGSGTPTNPYIITASAGALSDIFQVNDTTSVNLSLFGSGVSGNPLILRADVTMRVEDLSDIQDPEGGPSTGESLVWETDHWEFRTLPPAPAGSVNAANGLTGTGAVSTPLKVATSGVWGTAPLAGLGSDSTIGQVIYVDSAGQLRAAPANTAVAWTAITGKPSTFPPSPHTHVAADITDPQNLNVGMVGGIAFYATADSTTPPSLTTFPAAWLFPEGT